MSIHPRFAEAILAGDKQVEFRKRRLAPDVELVLIYATAPIQRVVGYFRIADQVVAAPDRLWERTGHGGGISRQYFDEYYGDSEVGVGIEVQQAVRFERARRLDELDPGLAPPQSFQYVSSDLPALRVLVGPGRKPAAELALR
jgi:predicted transcriptional regulator